MSHKAAAASYPTSIANPTTPDETQELEGSLRYHTAYKGNLTRAEIYEWSLPNDAGSCLSIDGPADGGNYIELDSFGRIHLVTGEKSKESGPGSGKLCIHTWGYQATHEEKASLVFNEGDSEDGQALNLLCYGDYVEESRGSTRYIKAQKIVITATEELMLVGGTQVNIQAGSEGGGSIIMNAGNIERITQNDKEVIIGQRMTYGVAEDTKVSFDPRASVNVISPGHINHKILGDHKVWVGGIEQHVIAGGPAAPPLIKDRDNSYSVEAVLGNVDMKSAAGLMNLTSGTITNITAGAAMNLTAVGNVTVKAATIFLN